MHKCDIERITYPRTKHWERYALLEEHLKYDYDYLVWIDADAYIYNDSPPLENIINLYDNKTFILSGAYDRYNSQYLNNEEHSNINSGFFIVKNNNFTKYFLKEIYTNMEWHKMKSNRWYDQAVLRYLYINNIDNFKDISIIIPYPILQCFPKCNPFFQPLSKNIFEKYIKPYFIKFNINKPLISHSVGSSNDERITFSQQYLNEINKNADNK